MEFKCLIGGKSSALSYTILCASDAVEQRAKEHIAQLHDKIQCMAWDLFRKTETVSSSLGVDDLVAVGIHGCVQAAERFCPSYGLSFELYTLKHAKYEMINEIRRQLHSRSAWSRKEKLYDAMDAVSREQGRPARDAEVAEHLSMTLEAFVAHKTRTISLAPTHIGGDVLNNDWECFRGDDPPPDERVHTLELMKMLGPALAGMGERDRELLRLRFEDDLTLEEIGERFGITKQRVWQLQQRLLRELRKSFSGRLGAEDKFNC